MKVIYNILELNTAFEKARAVLEKEPIILQIEKLSNKRTNNQLKALFRCISLIRLHLIDGGDLSYSNDEILDYFKIKAGLFKEVKGVKIPLSISDKAKRTKQEMNNLIEVILKTGSENGWDDVNLDNGEIQNIINNYKE